MAEISFLWLHWIDASDDDKLFGLRKRKFSAGPSSQPYVLNGDTLGRYEVLFEINHSRRYVAEIRETFH